MMMQERKINFMGISETRRETPGHDNYICMASGDPTGKYGVALDLTRFNKIATQGAPQMAVDKEANSLSRVYSYYSKFNLRLFYV